jgi:positive regulator of sigma E activity
MVTATQQRFLYGQLAWMLATLVVLATTEWLSLSTFYLVSFFGFLVLFEFTSSFNVSLQWQRRVERIVIVGALVFVYIVVRRLLAIVPSEVFRFL